MNRTLRVIAAAPSLLAGLATPFAPRAAPTPLLNITAAYQGGLLVKFLDLRMRTKVNGQHFQVDAHITSSGAVSFVHWFDIDAGAAGAVDRGWPVPAAYVQRKVEGGKHSTRTLVWKSPSRTTDPLTPVLRLNLSPLSASPCLGLVPIFDGKQRYDLVLSHAGPATLDDAQRRLGLSQPVQCRLEFRPLAGFKSNNQSGIRQFTRGDIHATFAKVAAAGLWIATDIGVDTLVGPADLRLTSLDIQGSRTAALATAADQARPRPPMPRSR
jgi:hypothetical protein